jgi:hypothetical protein
MKLRLNYFRIQDQLPPAAACDRIGEVRQIIRMSKILSVLRWYIDRLQMGQFEQNKNGAKIRSKRFESFGREQSL